MTVRALGVTAVLLVAACGEGSDTPTAAVDSSTTATTTAGSLVTCLTLPDGSCSGPPPPTQTAGDPLPEGFTPGPPKARPRPTLDLVLYDSEGAYDEDEFRAIADAQPSTYSEAGGGRTIGEVGGEQFVDFVYGDVSNYAGVAAFANDTVVVRVVRRLPPLPDGGLQFQVVHISALLRHVGNVGILSGTDRPPTWHWDDPATPWAD